MPKLRYTVQSRRDFNAIIGYIARQNGDFNTAKDFGRQLLRKCDGLLSAPGMGTQFGKSGLRKINFGAYKIIYETSTEEILILRFWDGRRGTNPKV